MKEQIIIAIGREHGSGGHYIAQMIAEELHISLYDRELVEVASEASGYCKEVVHRLDEKPVSLFFSRRVGDYSNSLEETVAIKTFQRLRELADSGESFVVVGRCADFVLRQNPNLLRIFVSGQREDKIRRVMQRDQVTEARAAELIKETDRRRKTYHNYYCDHKWGDSRGYDLTINSSPLGVHDTAVALVDYIRRFQAK